jgi:hypothetical protein
LTDRDPNILKSAGAYPVQLLAARKAAGTARP